MRFLSLLCPVCGQFFVEYDGEPPPIAVCLLCGSEVAPSSAAPPDEDPDAARLAATVDELLRRARWALRLGDAASAIERVTDATIGLSMFASVQRHLRLARRRNAS